MKHLRKFNESTVNKKELIDVDGNIYFYNQGLTKLPGGWNRVSGNFDCSSNKLTTLEGAPREVGNDFYCYDNELTSLEGAPREVGGNFYCHYNKLTNLMGAPKYIGGSFICVTNPLPQEILDNIEHIKYILKWQDDYSIWNLDGSLNKWRFEQMMNDMDLEK